MRLSYFKNSNGSVEVLEENNYYPFGMKHDANFISSGNSSYKYQYNGKEYQTETGWSDYGARMYMSDIARWGVIDPLAETSTRFNPYNYAYNNPVMFIDPDGRKAMAPDTWEWNISMSGAWGYMLGGGSATFGSYSEFLGEENPLAKFNKQGSNGGGGGGSSISSAALMNTMLSLGEVTWTNTGYGFESGSHIALGYDGSYQSLNTALDILIPEIIMKGEGSEWNGSSYNKAVLSSRITGALGNWNYDVNSGNMAQYIMNSKASMEVAEFEKFLFLELPASFAGGEFISAGWRAAGVTGRIGNALSKITTADGFMGGSIGFKLPFNLRVGLYASENTLKYETFKWSTIAPKALTKYEWFGRNMLQITPEFQSTLGNWSTQVIPKGTYIRIGLVGQQPGNALGTWLQFHAPGRVPFVP
ncbi:RHS repeat-associated core domain-containing protein [Chryseobacterium taeanense]|uniref:RHS repeat-associated core domain-containing protein n=1 Tax=Chryseobacterium taeanense TaxID=311334 RepID=A0A1G8FRQ1_9FLAO|nr:RHS repeat-associated core domain-containing protein [Chryseobacterium taeanense]SDH84795.1 RHS repeat-associated core domain-containing protein [Chryseobacterium taeanense]